MSYWQLRWWAKCGPVMRETTNIGAVRFFFAGELRLELEMPSEEEEFGDY